MAEHSGGGGRGESAGDKAREEFFSEAQEIVDGLSRDLLALDDVCRRGGSDAELVNGRLQKNRGWVARALQVKTEYVIEADLSGPIIRDEHIRRASVHLPLDWRDGRFEGSVNTSGSKVGGPDRMALTAKLVLHRAPDLIICHP